MGNRIADDRGNHHCPKRDGRKAHTIKSRCIDKQHCAYCPACGYLVDYIKGCQEHKDYRRECLSTIKPEIQKTNANTPARPTTANEDANAKKDSGQKDKGQSQGSKSGKQKS